MLRVLAAVFRQRQHAGPAWRAEVTYVLVGGQWRYLCRAVGRLGYTVNLVLTAPRDVAAARRFFERAMNLHGIPETVTIDKSGANAAAVRRPIADSGVPIKLRQPRYLNNVVEQTTPPSSVACSR